LNELNVLRKRLAEYLSRRALGILEFFNIYCMSMYRVDCISLFFTTPSKLYYILLTHFRGDTTSTDYAFTLLFLSPLTLLLGLKETEVVKELLDLVKIGRDKEFLELLARYARGDV